MLWTDDNSQLLLKRTSNNPVFVGAHPVRDASRHVTKSHRAQGALLQIIPTRLSKLPEGAMQTPPTNVLFLCTGNSARSVMAEAMLNVLGSDRFHAFSAGSFPSGAVQPIAAELAHNFGYHEPLRSKRWDEFAQTDSPPIDIVITVCDNAAGEVCPIWPGHPVTAHWGIPDPAAVNGSENERRRAFESAWTMLRRRIDRLLVLPLETLDHVSTQRELREIGDAECAHER
jgi:arsenate reductase